MKNAHIKNDAFSLIELLTVIAILTLLAALALPAFNAIGRNQELAGQGEIVSDLINQTRQLAATKNRSVELRLILKIDNGTTNWATQIFESSGITSAPVPLSRLQLFPDGVIINDLTAVSPLLGQLELATTNFPSLGNCAFYAVRFSPNGRLAKSVPLQHDYVTLQSRQDNLSKPVNYFAVQINPVTGRLGIYRP